MMKVMVVLVAMLAVPMMAFSAIPDLIINEVMSNPDPDRPNPFGFYDSVLERVIAADWIEIYNPGAEQVNLDGLYVSDDCAVPDRWEIPADQFPAPPGGTVVIWLPGYYRGFFNCAQAPDYRPCPNPIPQHMAPFRVSSESEWIGLYSKEGEDFVLIDGFEVPPMPFDQSYGCLPDGNKGSRGYLKVPTIGTPIGQSPEETQRMSGALNSTGQDNEIINLPPLIEVGSYRAEKGTGPCPEYSFIVDPGDRVRVRARVVDLEDEDRLDDDNQIDEVLLWWKDTAAGELRSEPMTLNPLDEDLKTYEAFIPAQDVGTVIEFWIWALDTDGVEGWSNRVGPEQPGGLEEPGIQYPVGARGSSSATLVINEILASNAGCPDYDEGEKQDPVQPLCQAGGRDRGQDSDRQQAEDWVELYNTGTSDQDLADLYLTNNELEPTQLSLEEAVGHHVSLDQNGKLPGQAHMLIWCDNEIWQNDNVGYHAPFGLTGREDEVLLIAYRDADADGDPDLFVILDHIAWGPGEEQNDEPHYHLGSQDPDWSLGRYPDGAGGTTGQPDDWGRMIPSPGTGYYPGASNTDHVPYVNVIGYEPETPVALDADHPITFRARVWDDKPLAADAVTLGYAALANPGALSYLVMRDDGTGGDALAGDTIYTAVADSPTLEGKLIFQVEVQDSDSNRVRIPVQTSQYVLFFVGEQQNDHLIISEVVAANRDCSCSVANPDFPERCELAGIDNFGEANDWVEIMNPTDSPIALDEYYLTDRLDWLTRWKFPTWAVVSPVDPGERIIVWCDQDLEQDSPDEGAIHADFLLDAGRDEIILVRGASDKQIVDFVALEDQIDDISYGRDETTGELGMLLEPTLRGENAQLAANAEWITELGDLNNPSPLESGSQVTVTGLALNQTSRVVIVDPQPCEPEEVRNWDWEGLSTAPVEPDWALQGEELKITLPGGLAAGQHLLCVLSGPNTNSETWFEGGVPFTRIQFSTTLGYGFTRGDSNLDAAVNIADAVYILQNLFAQGPPIDCLDAADSNDDESVNIADAIYILQNLFAQGPPIPAPTFPDCGPDPTGHPTGGPELAPCNHQCP